MLSLESLSRLKICSFQNINKYQTWINRSCGNNNHPAIFLHMIDITGVNFIMFYLEEMSSIWKTTGIDQRRHQIQSSTRHSAALRALKGIGVKDATNCLNFCLRKLGHSKMFQGIHHIGLVEVENPAI